MDDIRTRGHQHDLKWAAYMAELDKLSAQMFVDLGTALHRPVDTFKAGGNHYRGCRKGWLRCRYVGIGSAVPSGAPFMAIKIPKGRRYAGFWVIRQVKGQREILHNGKPLIFGDLREQNAVIEHLRAALH